MQTPINTGSVYNVYSVGSPLIARNRINFFYNSTLQTNRLRTNTIKIITSLLIISCFNEYLYKMKCNGERNVSYLGKEWIKLTNG